jgi:hypothetical protein
VSHRRHAPEEGQRKILQAGIVGAELVRRRRFSSVGGDRTDGGDDGSGREDLSSPFHVWYRTNVKLLSASPVRPIRHIGELNVYRHRNKIRRPLARTCLG